MAPSDQELSVDAIVERATTGFREDVQRIMAAVPDLDAADQELIARLRMMARQSSEISRQMAEAKSLRQDDNLERRTDLYMWPTPEQTPEWQAADRIEELARQSSSPAQSELLAKVVPMLERLSKVYDNWDPDGSYASSALFKAQTLACEALNLCRGGEDGE